MGDTEKILLKAAGWFTARNRRDRTAILAAEASASLALENLRAPENICALCLGGDFDAIVYEKMAKREKCAANPDDPWTFWTVMRDVRDAGLRRLPVAGQLSFWRKNLAGLVSGEDAPLPSEALENFGLRLDDWEKSPGKDVAGIFRMSALAHFEFVRLAPPFSGRGFCARLLDLRIRSFLPATLFLPMSAAFLADRPSYERELSGDGESFVSWHAFRAVCGMYNQVRGTSL